MTAHHPHHGFLGKFVNQLMIKSVLKKKAKSSYVDAEALESIISFCLLKSFNFTLMAIKSRRE